MAQTEEKITLKSLRRELEEGADRIYSDNFTYPEYTRLYTRLFEFCSNIPYGVSDANRQLHERLTTIVRKYAKAAYNKCGDLANEPLLAIYVKLWQDYRKASKVLDGICAYMNRCWVRRQREKCRRLEMFEIFHLSLFEWKNNLVTPLKQRLSDALLNSINLNRNGEVINISLIKVVLDSYIEIGVNYVDPHLEPNLEFYKETFENPFLDETESFYNLECGSYRERFSTPEFMKKVDVWISEEEKEAQLYLRKNTLEKLNCVLKRVLISNHKSLFLEEFDTLLADNKLEDLNRMYRLLCLISEGMDELSAQFGEYIIRQGLLAIEEYINCHSNEPKAYIKTILDVHQKFDNIASTVFESDAGFCAAFHKACGKFINKNSVTESGGSTSKSAELLAKYCDLLLKQKTSDTEEAELVNNLDRAIIVFKYIEERDIFQSFYSKLFAKRLVQQLNAADNFHTEQIMITKLREACGWQYTSKLQGMFQDVCVSRDLNEQFKNDGCPLDVDFNINVIKSSSWPFSPSLTFTLPQELEQSVQQFTTFYSSRFSGRKLSWLLSMSRGELVSYCFEKKHTFQVSTFQMAVLLQFNNATTLSFNQLEDSTGIRTDILLQVLQALTKLKLLNETEGNSVTESSSFTINVTYKNKKLKLNINAPIKSEVKSEQDAVQKHVNEDRKILIQAAIVRVAKTRRVVHHQALMTEVISQLSSRFKPQIPMIKKCIELLIEKNYLNRNEDDTYNYIA